MKATQKMINRSAVMVEQTEKKNEKGNNIIQSIMALDLIEEKVKAAKKHSMKNYATTILRRLTASAAKIKAPPATTTTPITLSNNIKNIQTKLDKMKAFVVTTKEVVCKEGTETEVRIKTNVETIFNDQQSTIKSRADTIKTTVKTKLNQHKESLKGAVEAIRLERIKHLNMIDMRK